MKGKIIVGSLVLAIAGFQSCQKLDSNKTSDANLSTNLYAAASDVVTTAVTQSTSADEHSVSVEKFNGLSDAYVFGDGKHGGDYGKIMWGMGPVKFGIPHIDSCATVTVSSDTYPKEIVIDYGDGCTDRRGHTVSGKIIIDLSDSINVAGATKTITYQDFYIDSMQVQLTASVTNLGMNADGHWVIEKKYDQTVIKNGETSVQSSDETMEWTQGFETTDKSDDIYYVTGSGSVTLNDSVTFSKTITKPLLVDRSCEFIVSGTVELVRNGNTIIIDYGDGTCDDVATVTTNGTTEEINLHSNRFHEGGRFGKHCNGFGRERRGKRG